MYRAIATDYDGTLACEGRVDEPTVDALLRARAAGLSLLMVTGRELTDLSNTFAHTDLFDLVVAENGAVLFDPANSALTPLAPAPPPALLTRLEDAGVPLSVGHSIVATVEPHQHTLLDAIRSLGLEWHVVFNKGSVMALPADVTKATGLAAALVRLSIRPDAVVGIGDAENDQVFLRACGVAVAVANALPSVKQLASVVTAGARGAGVAEAIELLLAGQL